MLVQLAPELDLVDPNEDDQGLTRGQQTVPFDFHARANVTIPGFNATPVDEVVLNVTDSDGNDVDSLRWTNATDQVNDSLDASAFDAVGEEYTFTYEARHGTTTVSTTTQVLVEDGGAYQTFQDDRNRGYGNLTPSAGEDRERWEFQAGSCGLNEDQWVRVTLFATPVDLYLDDTSPEQVGSDPAAYGQTDTGSDFQKTIWWDNAGDGETFTAMVLARENVTVVEDYEVFWDAYCVDEDDEDVECQPCAEYPDPDR